MVASCLERDICYCNANCKKYFFKKICRNPNNFRRKQRKKKRIEKTKLEKMEMDKIETQEEVDQKFYVNKHRKEKVHPDYLKSDFEEEIIRKSRGMSIEDKEAEKEKEGVKKKVKEIEEGIENQNQGKEKEAKPKSISSIPPSVFDSASKWKSIMKDAKIRERGKKNIDKWSDDGFAFEEKRKGEFQQLGETLGREVLITTSTGSWSYCYDDKKDNDNFVGRNTDGRPVRGLDRLHTNDLSYQEFVDRYERYNFPVIIEGIPKAQGWEAAEEWALDRLIARHPKLLDYRMKCGEDDDGYAIRVRLEHYYQYYLHQQDDSPLYVFDSKFGDTSTNTTNSTTTETQKNEDNHNSTSKANKEEEEERKLNGTTKTSTAMVTTVTTTEETSSLMNPVGAVLNAYYNRPKYFPDDVFELTGEERRPPYKWFLVGPQRSGTNVHIDPLGTSAWNTVLLGRKRWVLFPPSVGKTVAKGLSRFPRNSRKEAINYFVDALENVKANLCDNQVCYELIQYPGETIYVPGGWWHGVINLDNTVAVTQNLCSRHNFHTCWRKTRDGRFQMGWKLYRQLAKISQGKKGGRSGINLIKLEIENSRIAAIESTASSAAYNDAYYSSSSEESSSGVDDTDDDNNKNKNKNDNNDSNDNDSAGEEEEEEEEEEDNKTQSSSSECDSSNQEMKNQKRIKTHSSSFRQANGKNPKNSSSTHIDYENYYYPQHVYTPLYKIARQQNEEDDWDYERENEKLKEKREEKRKKKQAKKAKKLEKKRQKEAMKLEKIEKAKTYDGSKSKSKNGRTTTENEMIYGNMPTSTSTPTFVSTSDSSLTAKETNTKKRKQQKKGKGENSDDDDDDDDDDNDNGMKIEQGVQDSGKSGCSAGKTKKADILKMEEEDDYRTLTFASFSQKKMKKNHQNLHGK